MLEILITNVVLFCTRVISVALALSDATEPPLPLCQFGYWVYTDMLVVRLLGLLIFSVLMFQTVACSRRRIQTIKVVDVQFDCSLGDSNTIKN